MFLHRALLRLSEAIIVLFLCLFMYVYMYQANKENSVMYKLTLKFIDLF